jgi:antitoxin (DNA-binding transcriptional repressor) of toxin-antitoxin stability system
MATIHIPEAEAARDLPGLLARVRAGEEVVIVNETGPPVVLRVAVEPAGRLLSEAIELAKKHADELPRRSISESIALAEARSQELGYKPVMDAGFASDLEEIIRTRKPRDTSAWG